VKNLLFFLLVVATAGLFFHDKQQTADLAKAQQDNATLTQQLADKTAEVEKAQQARVAAPQAAVPTLTSRPLQPSAAPQSTWSLQGSSLDRGAYKDGH
jgi:hypothetical protein